MTKEDWDDWRINPLTKEWFVSLATREQEAMEAMLTCPRDEVDTYRGFILAYREMRNASFEEIIDDPS